jgi:hypothetical protein
MYGEPQVAQAIALEGQLEAGASQATTQTETAPHSHADAQTPAHAEQENPTVQPAPAAHSHGEAEEELVSRSTQAGLGLFTALVVFGTAAGGLFALVFALAYGRIGHNPRALAAFLAAAAFVTLVLVPNLKYPANPPAVGMAESIGYRTALYFFTIASAVLGVVSALQLRRVLLARLGAWDSAMVAAAVFAMLMALLLRLLPSLNEVPSAFPATLLWQFRISAMGIQLLLWTSIGLIFGALVARLPRIAPRQTA